MHTLHYDNILRTQGFGPPQPFSTYCLPLAFAQNLCPMQVLLYTASTVNELVRKVHNKQESGNLPMPFQVVLHEARVCKLFSSE